MSSVGNLKCHSFSIYILVDTTEDGDNPMPQFVFIYLYDGVLISLPPTSSAAQQVQYCGNELYSTECVKCIVLEYSTLQYSVPGFYSTHDVTCWYEYTIINEEFLGLREFFAGLGMSFWISRALTGCGMYAERSFGYTVSHIQQFSVLAARIMSYLQK